MKNEPDKMSAAWPPKAARRAPRPSGFLSGRRIALRRWLSISLSAVNRLLDRLPPGRWLHRIVQRGLEFTDVPIQLRRGDPALDGLKIAFLSDIHAGSYMNETDLCRIFEKVQEYEPDLVCLGGDLINTREREILMYRNAIPILTPRFGVYAVPGNHDHFWGRDLGLWSPFLRELGVHVLNNAGTRIDVAGSVAGDGAGGKGTLWLAGVDDLTEGEPDLTAALQGSRPDEPVILLSHHPDFFFEAAAVGVDLTLSGHTHGGQVVFFGRAPVVHSHFGYLKGLFEEGDSRLYVGCGAGVTLLPIRIGVPAEVPIITLRVAYQDEPSAT